MLRLFGDYYLNADRFGYTVGVLSANSERGGETRVKPAILRQPRYYPSLSSAVVSTADFALRDAIATGEVQTLQEAVEDLRRIRDEILTAVGGEEVEQNG